MIGIMQGLDACVCEGEREGNKDMLHNAELLTTSCRKGKKITNRLA